MSALSLPGVPPCPPLPPAAPPAVPPPHIYFLGGRNHPALGRAATPVPVLSTAPLQAGFWQRVQAGSPRSAALPWMGQILFRAALAGTAGCRLAALPGSGVRVLSTPLGS